MMSSASTGPSSPQELTDLQRKLKENESQRTEVTGYINQLSIQLHRWKLRLQTLNERKTELEGEIRRTT
jgi:chromosome segregation ATPase